MNKTRLQPFIAFAVVVLLMPIAAPAQLRVVDSMGTVVGEVIGVDGKIPLVPLHLPDGRFIVTGVTEESFVNVGRVLGFESHDCTGQGYLFDEEGLFPKSSIAAPGQTLYVEVPDAAPRSVTFHSEWRLDGSCRTRSSGDEATNQVPAQPVFNLDAKFTAPFGFAVAEPPENRVCDTNGDGVIDRTDVFAVFASRNAPAEPNDPRDADGDGTITYNDARRCISMCTKPNCAH